MEFDAARREVDWQNFVSDVASCAPLAKSGSTFECLKEANSSEITLGIFLLIAIRNPLASRSLIAFTAWSSFVHAAVMGTQAMRNIVSRGELVGVAVLIVIGATLLALAPAQQRVAPALG